MIGNILDNTTELYMMKYAFGEIFSSGGATLYKNPSDQTVCLDGSTGLIFHMWYEWFTKLISIRWSLDEFHSVGRSGWKNLTAPQIW